MVKMDGQTIPDGTGEAQGSTESIGKRVIDATAIRTAHETLQKYMAGKQELDKRIIDNEDWWKLQHWRNFHQNELDREEQSTSAWLFNSIANKHADAMDSYPVPAVLPRSLDDEGTAKTLSSILPAIFDNCNFEQIYSDNWWDKLKNGCAIYAVMWDQSKKHGQGDISIRGVDMLSFYWEPGIQDIQDSKNIFVLALADNDALEAQYPQLQGKLSGNSIDKKQYHYDDAVDTTGKSIVVDWYYKVQTETGPLVHYVKYVDETVLFASEDTPGYEDGIYDHGKYPFVLDVLYAEKGTPAGFGYVDICKSPQEYIDRLGMALLLNAEEAAQRRYFVKDGCQVNEEELLDIHKRVIHVAGSPNDDNIRSFDTPELSTVYLSVLQDKVNELKETSANRDFNQGGTASGVTAASAITALQEAGNKTSRDLIKSSYRCYTQICIMVIDLMRQFYDISRTFRITGEQGTPEYVEFNNGGLKGGEKSVAGQDFRTKEPIFDVIPSAQKQNPYSKLSQNEMALQFYNSGFFNPQLADQVLQCIDMMDFDGKEKVRQGIQQNGTMYQQMQQLTQIATMAAQALAQKGDSRVLMAMQQMGLGADQTQQMAQGQQTQAEVDNDNSQNQN
nr:MAG TPA: portal protein [Caudoviricetes sp.]